MKYMYIVEYWEPFSKTQHGGLFVVIAKDDKECFELVADLYSQCSVNKNSLIRNKINQAKKYALLDPNITSQIVEELLT